MWIVLVLLIVLVAVLVLRTLMIKPTAAMNAKVELVNDERSQEYGKR